MSDRRQRLLFTVLVAAMTLCMMLSFCRYLLWFNAHPLPQYVAFHWRTQETSTIAAIQPQTTQADPLVVHTTKSNVHLTACIFTSFKDSKRKEPVYKNTIRNWSRFLPDIQPVLFSANMSSPFTSYAEDNGWKVVPCPKTNKFGTPFLKEMYLSAYNLVNASLYGFSNGDILFDGGLLLSLKRIREESNILNDTLSIGRRWHYTMKPNEDLGNFTQAQIKSLADVKFSKNCSGIAEDFFFVNKQFPWARIKDVVIGRPAYDNYLVGRAITLNVSTVDVTKTVSAIHQVDREGKFSGFHMKDSGYNYKVIGRFDHRKGNADNAWFGTQFDYKGDVVLMKQKISVQMLQEIYRKSNKIH